METLTLASVLADTVLIAYGILATSAIVKKTIQISLQYDSVRSEVYTRSIGHANTNEARLPSATLFSRISTELAISFIAN